jgi:Rod binding domain-containing protein
MAALPPVSTADPSSWVAGQTVQPATADDSQTVVSAAANVRSGKQSREAKVKAVGQQFEAVYLRQMLEECMPKDSDALYGKGTSGTMWRSMLADSLATTLSKTGTIGLAQMITKSKIGSAEGQ